ncbi:MAG: cytosine permease, partial [Gaiellaceae bacterium]
VVDGGLPLWWAVAAMMVGQALAYALLVIVAQPGVDYGLPGQVAMRAHLGFWGARLLSSPYRVIAATYWFAAQALTAGLGAQAIFEAMTGDRLPLVPLALVFAVVHATFAVLGFDVMRWLLRVVLPVSLAFSGILIALFLATDDPDYAVSRVFESPEQNLTWVGFATYVTVMCGASLTLVGNIADFCRYTPTRRDMRIGLAVSAVSAAVLTTFVGGYAAAATGETNPFVAVAELVSSEALLVVLLVAIVVQGLAANITNVYTAGLSVVNTIPQLGRLWATVAVAAAAVALSGFPDLVDHAQRWITHLGNLGAPLTGVILADYLVIGRRRIDVPALFASRGRYRYLKGVNVAAV